MDAALFADTQRLKAFCERFAAEKQIVARIHEELWRSSASASSLPVLSVHYTNLMDRVDHLSQYYSALENATMDLCDALEHCSNEIATILEDATWSNRNVLNSLEVDALDY